MSRMSAGARHTMHRSSGAGQSSAGEIENIAYTEPTLISACKVRVGMVVSVLPMSETDRPRKFLVRSIGHGDKWEEVEGKVKRFPAIFFNGNGAKKFRARTKLLLHFSPDPVRDGVKTKPLKPERVTTEEEKEQNAQQRERARQILADIITKYGSPDVHAL